MGDNVDLIAESFARAFQRAELVIATGGLGPTHDDLTKKAIVKYFKRPLILHDNILKNIESRFKQRGQTMPAINQNQALLPQGATFIENEYGSAVGIAIDEDGKLFVATPGVPDEMGAMISGWVVEAIRKRSGNLITIHRTLKTTGIMESVLFEKVADLVEIKAGGAAEDRLSVAFLPMRMGTNIRLTVVTRVREQGQRTINELEAKIVDRAGKYIYGLDDDTLPGVVERLLKEKGQTLAVAESCTGGLLGKLITDIPGSSDYFIGGVITYSNDMKKKLLSVPDDILARYGAVSDECARAMAVGVVKNLGASIGISITGVAGPDGGTDEKPVGLVYIGLAAPGKLESRQFNFGNERDRNRERSAISALDMIRKHLLGIA